MNSTRNDGACSNKARSINNGDNGVAKRHGRFIAVANMKGGVGKTTTVVSLAETLAADDLAARILVIDLDPQASASVCVAGDERLWQLINSDRTFEAFLEKRLILQEKASINSAICDDFQTPLHGGSPLSLSLLPCGPELRIVERELIYELTERNNSMNAIDGKIWALFDKDIQGLAEE